ncbi:hypothetical protein OBBRIDRAFT_792800 [Obba rivulosa]|uniref:Uncharacterized protein n=1 Tax=Obba rivulosa TaxID=1052685 RepID=A0A8E2AUM6_9APHY|nr:hypothetical protein OBBRIDRAFT_792800 [Obba rivulosa]
MREILHVKGSTIEGLSVLSAETLAGLVNIMKMLQSPRLHAACPTNTSGDQSQ